MNRRQMLEELEFKEERISMWEQFGCIMSDDSSTYRFIYPEVRV
ncbi:MAG: hypothetical protein ACP5NV_01075 [Candidatus Woesearchaeota archaeon]